MAFKIKLFQIIVSFLGSSAESMGNLELPKLAKGVKPGINRNEVYSISVQIPPLPEQKRIVGILDKAFVAITTAKKRRKESVKRPRAF